MDCFGGSKSVSSLVLMDGFAFDVAHKIERRNFSFGLASM